MNLQDSAAYRRASALVWMLIAAGVVSAGVVSAAAQMPPGTPPTGTAMPNSGAQTPAQQQAPAKSAPASPSTLMSAINGSVTEGTISSQPVQLSLDDAIATGLRNNLSALLASGATEQARAQHMVLLSGLLPVVNASASELREKINLAAFGITVAGVPPIVGPFNLFTAQVSGSVPLFNLTSIEANRAGNQAYEASKKSLQAVREMVVLAVANQYMLTLADQAKVAAAQADHDTAVDELTKAQDMQKAGTVNGLDVVRAHVQEQHLQQQILSTQNDLAKQRLQLARAIGLPQGQTFNLTSSFPADAAANPSVAKDDATLNADLAQALSTRPDFAAAQSLVRAEQYQLAATKAARYPSVSFDASYGPVGHELDSNHPVYNYGLSVSTPLFAGGLLNSNIIAAQAQLKDAQNRLSDLRASIENQVRNALLDAQSYAAQVAVAKDALDLANQQMTLSSDRFHAGVADNLEVVQAQQGLADAQNNLIESQYAFHIALAALAQAMGVAESSYTKFLMPR